MTPEDKHIADKHIADSTGYIHDLIAQKEALDRAAIVAFTDLKGTILEINDMFCQISGYAREELIGQNHRILNSGYHPRSFFKNLFATVGKGGIWRNEICNRNKSGEVYWVDTTIAPVKDEQGKIVKYMAIRFDITEKKKAEQNSQETLNALQGANDELAQFAYRASHDLKSPVSRSRALLEYVIKDVQGGDVDHAMGNAQKIVTQLRSLEGLVVDILSLARADLISEEREEIDFDEMVDQILSRLEFDITQSGCRVERDIRVAGSIQGEAGRYEQILYNLIGNGVRFCDQSKPTPFVKLSLYDQDDTLFLRVEDNGLGIPANKHDDVFTMFEKFHPDIKDGSGLGLSIVKKHVDALGGTIRFQSTQAGTCFSLEIPI